MIKTLYIFTVIMLLHSCMADKNRPSDIDWQKELIGVGYLGEHPDSLNALFGYYPCLNNQPESVSHLFEFQPKVNNDTIIFPNFMLRDLCKNADFNVENSFDSSAFKISLDHGFYKFSKIKGPDFIPKTFYFKKYSNEFPKNFTYQAISGFGRWDNFEIEINGKDSIKVWLKGSAHNPYLLVQNRANEIDQLFISSYLNMVCESRYDTLTFPQNETIFCGTSIDEILVYNDSVFQYNTYFKRYPDSGILVNYFRSKLNREIHSLIDFDVNMRSPIHRKKFEKLPVAVKNWLVLAPPARS